MVFFFLCLFLLQFQHHTSSPFISSEVSSSSSFSYISSSSRPPRPTAILHRIAVNLDLFTLSISGELWDCGLNIRWPRLRDLAVTTTFSRLYLLQSRSASMNNDFFYLQPSRSLLTKMICVRSCDKGNLYPWIYSWSLASNVSKRRAGEWWMRYWFVYHDL